MVTITGKVTSPKDNTAAVTPMAAPRGYIDCQQGYLADVEEAYAVDGWVEDH